MTTTIGKADFPLNGLLLFRALSVAKILGQTHVINGSKHLSHTQPEECTTLKKKYVLHP